MSDKKGDQQARAELLGKLLAAIGEKPYLVKHDTDKKTYCLIMVPVTGDEVKQWASQLKSAPVAITVGGVALMPLQLEPKSEIGAIESRLYAADSQKWTAAISATPFK